MPVNNTGVICASTIIGELGLTGKRSFSALQNSAFSTASTTLTKFSHFYSYNNNFQIIFFFILLSHD